MACVTFLASSNFLWSTLNDDGATTSASLGSEVDDVVGHKLHLDGDGACPLTLLATSSVGIEREMSWRDVPLFKVFINEFR